MLDDLKGAIVIVQSIVRHIMAMWASEVGGYKLGVAAGFASEVSLALTLISYVSNCCPASKQNLDYWEDG